MSPLSSSEPPSDGATSNDLSSDVSPESSSADETSLHIPNKENGEVDFMPRTPWASAAVMVTGYGHQNGRRDLDLASPLLTSTFQNADVLEHNGNRSSERITDSSESSSDKSFVQITPIGSITNSPTRSTKMESKQPSGSLAASMAESRPTSDGQTGFSFLENITTSCCQAIIMGVVYQILINDLEASPLRNSLWSIGASSLVCLTVEIATVVASSGIGCSGYAWLHRLKDAATKLLTCILYRLGFVVGYVARIFIDGVMDGYAT